MPISREEFEENKEDMDDVEDYSERVNSFIEKPEKFLYEHPDKAFTADEIANRVAKMAKAAEHGNVPSPQRARNQVKGKIQVQDRFVHKVEDVEREYHPQEDEIFYISAKE